jgi:DnaD/phage-associated family protein
MDSKWPVIAARSGVKVGIVSAIAWALLDYASQHEKRGTVTGFDTEVYAIYSGFPESDIIAVIQAMTDKGIIVDGRLANWEKRQPKREDDSRDRVTKHRELKRIVTQRNAPDTDTDTESDKESESDKEKRLKTPVVQSLQIDPELGQLAREYESNFGVLTPRVNDLLADDLGQYGLQLCLDAMTEALNNNVRKWSYVQGILKRWYAEGRGAKTNGKDKTPAPPGIAYFDVGTERLYYQDGILIRTEALNES